MHVLDKFWARVSPEPNTGCWLWMGQSNGRGYGRLHLHDHQLVLAHRFSWEIHKGLVPDGLELDHLCKVKICVNPDHLEPVTHEENIARGNGGWMQRAQTECVNGHEFTAENTYNYLSKRGISKRQCKECNRIRSRLWQRVNKRK